ncbi:hypothetical protein GW17_00031542 [Ensete ventricosum]|nr:hypothetical protein GW17_00031542 [Ensete ventricosum]
MKTHEHRIDIGDEKSDLLGYEIFSGKLFLYKKMKSTRDEEQTGSGTINSDSMDAKLTSKALIWGSNVLSLEDVISVSYKACFRHFTVHAYPVRKRSCGLSCLLKPQRSQKDFHFLASSSEEAIQWVQSFADQQCYINCSPHPMVSGKKQDSDVVTSVPLYGMPYIKCKSPPRILVVLNPRSGHGRSILELSEKYQKRFGPLRYFVAGFLKFMCLPKYSFEVEYLPMSKEIGNSKGKVLANQGKKDISDIYTDTMQRSTKDGIPRASSLSSIDSIMSPNRMSGKDMDTTGSTIASIGLSDSVRGLDPKAKQMSSGRSNLVDEPDEVIHPQPHLSANSNWPRTRSKSRTDKTWTSQTTSNDSRYSWAATSLYDKEDISSTVSDPGPVWDSEPKWDAEPNWEAENPIELPGPPDDMEQVMEKVPVPSLEDKWVVKKGQFLGVLVCNHSCKTVQSLSSQVVAPKAVHDDNSLDLLLVCGSGRFRLLKFFICLQFGRHLSLPYVDYIKRIWTLYCNMNSFPSNNGQWLFMEEEEEEEEAQKVERFPKNSGVGFWIPSREEDTKREADVGPLSATVKK